MKAVYPKIIVYCPEEEREINGNLCVNCSFYRGISHNDIIAGRFYIRCSYKDNNVLFEDNKDKE